MTRIVRLSIANMAGVPSIVYGLFGLALFVLTMGLGRSVLAGALTLACLTLPVVITATEEALRQVPKDLRQASLALGASRLRTTWRVVIPAAAPGIMTGSILGLSRAAGETAPILVTAVAFYAPVPPTVFDETMALPYHLYIMATQATKPAPHIVWGTALVLVAGVTVINVAASAWRSKQRSKIRW
jgi:phosphate transport system permease protein